MRSSSNFATNVTPTSSNMSGSRYAPKPNSRPNRVSKNPSTVLPAEVPSAFSNYGLEIAGQNEDNLFGSREDEYSPFNAYAWDNDKKANGVGKDDTGLSWDEFMDTEDGQRLALQIKMTSASSYLQQGAEASDCAPYWYVRHGMMDRDTAWATEAILYYSALNNADVKDLNFEFAWLKGHQGDYDVQEAYAWLKSIL